MMKRETYYTPAMVASLPIEDAMKLLGGRYVDATPPTTTQTPAGFGRYIRSIGVRHFTSKEATTPRHKRKAKSVGYQHFVPSLFLWQLAGCVLLLADAQRKAVGRSVTLRNLWRPMSYNRLVAKSGIKSDHPNACGVDLTFQTAGDRAVAEGLIRGLHLAHPWLGLRLGIGPRILHVGLLAPVGTRTWWYGTPRGKRVKL